MKRIITSIALWFAVAAPNAWAESAPDVWASYLDYAYVYSSADPAALQERLAQYGSEAGIEFDDYLHERHTLGLDDTDIGAIRRHAIALLLDYLSRGEPASLDASVDTRFLGAKTAAENHAEKLERKNVEIEVALGSSSRAPARAEASPASGPAGAPVGRPCPASCGRHGRLEPRSFTCGRVPHQVRRAGSRPCRGVL